MTESELNPGWRGPGGHSFRQNFLGPHVQVETIFKIFLESGSSRSRRSIRSSHRASVNDNRTDADRTESDRGAVNRFVPANACPKKFWEWNSSRALGNRPMIGTILSDAGLRVPNRGHVGRTRPDRTGKIELQIGGRDDADRLINASSGCPRTGADFSKNTSFKSLYSWVLWVLGPNELTRELGRSQNDRFTRDTTVDRRKNRFEELLIGQITGNLVKRWRHFVKLITSFSTWRIRTLSLPVKRSA